MSPQIDRLSTLIALAGITFALRRFWFWFERTER